MDLWTAIIIMVALAFLFYTIGYASGHNKGVTKGRRLEEKDHVDNKY
jgi:hypothetical protein